MKLLIIVCGHEFNTKWRDNIIILNNYIKKTKYRSRILWYNKSRN